MDNDGIHFCTECYNLTFLHLDEEDKLIHACKTCQKTESFSGNNCIYSVDYEKIDKSQLMNTNKYITHDKTLPSIKDNPNIKCPNKECNDRSSFKYIKYNTEDMNYMYICEKCGQKWTN